MAEDHDVRKKGKERDGLVAGRGPAVILFQRNVRTVHVARAHAAIHPLMTEML